MTTISEISPDELDHVDLDSFDDPHRTAFHKKRKQLRAYVMFAGLCLAGLAVAWPFIASNNYLLVEGTLALIWIGLALSWNMMSGFTGYISFGHAALFAIGAYFFAKLVTATSMNLVVALLIAFVGTALFSLLLGLLTLRLKSHYFAIATFAVAEALNVIVSNEQPLGGTTGFPMPYSFIGLSTRVEYYAVFGIAVFIALVSIAILWSKHGLRLLTIREDEIAAESIGIRTIRYKLVMFTLSGAFTGLLGGMYVLILSYISPDSVLSTNISLQVSAMAIIGGMGTVLGPIIGAVAFFSLGEATTASSANLHLLIEGAFLVVCMLFLRRGLVGSLERTKIWPRGFRL